MTTAQATVNTTSGTGDETIYLKVIYMYRIGCKLVQLKTNYRWCINTVGVLVQFKCNISLFPEDQ